MRSNVLVLALAGLAFAAAPASARPRAPGAVAPATAVTVDVNRLRALGLGITADRVAAAVARELGGGVPGARLVVRLTGLSLNSYAGQSGGTGSAGGAGGGASGGTDYDYLEGDILLVGPGGQILSQRHQVASSPSSAGGAYYLPGAEERRVDALARNFAYWVLRDAS